MTNYTDGQIEYLAAGFEHDGMTHVRNVLRSLIAERIDLNRTIAELCEAQKTLHRQIAERQAAKAVVLTDEVVERACIAAEKFGFISYQNIVRRVAMRAALASVWPTVGGDGRNDAAALEHFTEYFVRNYPGPNTIIGDPKWHAPKIFRAAKYAIAATEGEKK